MTKKQKIWLGIFMAMAIVPEIFFGGLISTFFKLRFVPLFNTSNFFASLPILGYLNLWSENLGVIGLIFLNKKFNFQNRFLKFLIIGILLIILACLLTITYYYYTFNPSLP
jgi:hypothetical protein